jgi:hypothetical protein
VFNELTVAKSEFAKQFPWIFKLKMWYHWILIFFITCKCIFGGLSRLHCCTGTFLGKEGGIQVLAGLAPSSQTVGSIFKIPLLGKLARKIWRIVSSMSSLQYKNIKNAFIEHILQSQKFDKPSRYFKLFCSKLYTIVIKWVFIDRIKLLPLSTAKCKNVCPIGFETYI